MHVERPGQEEAQYREEKGDRNALAQPSAQKKEEHVRQCDPEVFSEEDDRRRADHRSTRLRCGGDPTARDDPANRQHKRRPPPPSARGCAQPDLPPEAVEECETDEEHQSTRHER